MTMNNKKSLTIAGLMIGVVIVIGGIYTTVIANSQHQNGMSMETKTFQNLNSEATESKNQSIISLGNFVSGEHPTSGKVVIINRNNKRFLQLSKNFKTSSMGPDLVVILHRESDVIASTEPPAYPIKQGDYVIISPLQSFSGIQTYEIPDNVNLNDFKSVAIWCRKFNATFGAASLTKQS